MKTLLLKSLKALLLCFCLLCITSSFSFSQEKRGHYQGEVNAEFCIAASLQLHTIHGIRYNDYCFFGIGTGIHFNASENLKPNYTGSFQYGTIGVPLFLDIKGYLPMGEKRKVSLIGILDGGATLFLKHSPNYTYNLSRLQLFANPQIGFDFRTGKKSSIYITFGYLYEAGSQLSARLGFTF